MMLRHQVTFTFTLALALTTTITLSSCSKWTQPPFESDPVDGTTPRKWSNQLLQTLQIVDHRSQPVPFAQILIGMAANEPFPNNFIVTDEQGIATVPTDWQTPLPVTIEASPYARITYYNQLPSRKIYPLGTRFYEPKPEISGTTAGYTQLKNDGIVDLSIVHEVFQREAVPTFRLEDILSSQIDILDVVGRKIPLPSNLSLPKQTESYIIPITLQKNKFRMIPKPQAESIYKFAAVHAKANLERLISKFSKGAPILDIINEFNTMGRGMGSTVVENQEFTIAVNQVKLQSEILVLPPARMSSEIVIGIALSQSSDNEWVVEDIKNLAPDRPTPLKVSKLESSRLLYIKATTEHLRTMKEVSLSSYLEVEPTSTVRPLLDLVPPPIFSTPNTFIAFPPADFSKIYSDATYCVLSKIEERDNGSYRYEIRRVLWEFYSPQWTQETKIPLWPVISEELDISQTNRFEVYFLGGTQPIQKELAPSIMKQVTHVSRSNTNF